MSAALISIATVYALARLGDRLARLDRDTDPWSPQ